MKYPYLSNLPHSSNMLAVPISGLVTELMDRKSALSGIKTITPTSKLLLSKKHKEASKRIATCLGYLITITHRLQRPQELLFTNLHLDWENLIIYSQIMLDSFAVLVPIFYELPEKYQRIDDPKLYPVNGFNNLHDWFSYHGISDKLTQRYKLIRRPQSWYKFLNIDRKDYIHGFKTPTIISLTAVHEAGFKMRKNKIFNMRDVKENWVKPVTVENEIKTLLRNLLEFLTFCDFFLKEELEKRNIYISNDAQFKFSLWGYDFREFNKLIFKSPD